MKSFANGKLDETDVTVLLPFGNQYFSLISLKEYEDLNENFCGEKNVKLIV